MTENVIVLSERFIQNLIRPSARGTVENETLVKSYYTLKNYS